MGPRSADRGQKASTDAAASSPLAVPERADGRMPPDGSVNDVG